jgi:flagellar hook-associated protein 2
MGTVGLSFGSPTSGAGFDVSSTVAQIVGNLQKVETPWKTQLTSLESQDTAISSLGTLFSNLSNNMSSLTDFQGILAQKTGSSSDTNVLELTSATASATAGTHTVVVNTLAATSSGYTAEVTSSSASLSGQITLQMGNGKAQTFVIGSGTSGNGKIYTGSKAETLSDLASAINSSGVGITANVESDSTGSWLSLTSRTSGAGGNIAVTANSLSAAAANTLSYTGTAGTSTAYSTGTLAAVSSSSEALSGTLSIQVGNNTAQTIYLGQSSDSGAPAGALDTGTSTNTLSSLKDFINSNQQALGVKASIVTNSDGTSSLALTSLTSTGAGTLSVNSAITDAKTSLGYTAAVTGVDANLTIDGKSNIHSSSNTVSNLIPGLTFQLLATSSNPVQVVIGNDNTDIESTVNSFVSNYNSLISAVNTQEGNDSSGNPEPLFGSPTLSLLQQQLLGSLNTQSPNGSFDAVPTVAGTTLSGSISISLAGGLPMNYSGMAGSDSETSNGTLSGIHNAADTLSGTLSIQVGSGTATSVTMDQVSSEEGGTSLTDLNQYINDNSSTLGVTSSIVTNTDGTSSLSLLSGSSGTAGSLTVSSTLADTSAQTVAVPTSSENNNIAGLASAINAANIGVTAEVVTSQGQSTLTLISQVEGSSGALDVTSALTSTTPTPLTFNDSATYTSTSADTGTLDSVAGKNDALSGSISIQVGNGTATSVTMDEVNTAEGGTTLSDVNQYINDNSTTLGVTASIVNNSDGSQSLSLVSGTDGSAGALTITPRLYDTTSPTSTALNYTTSSDISSLTSLGIGVNNDGTLTFDASTLDSLLDSDFSSVVGFFQNADSWGQSFSTMLTNAGSSSSTGILKLASNSNSSTESTLNAEVSKEQSYISAQQISLTAELNSANEIMQMLPSQLQGVNELYSAITGYNQNLNG